MIKRIFIIGDSHIHHMSGEFTSLTKPKALEIGYSFKERKNYDLFFVWQHSRTAFKVDLEYLESLLNKHLSDINEETVIILEFGIMDILLGYFSKYKNEEEVIAKYVNEGIKFANKYKTNLIFMVPWCKTQNTEIYNFLQKIENVLEVKSLENNIPIPIKVLENAVERQYTPFDLLGHNTREDYEKILDYITFKVKEIDNGK